MHVAIIRESAHSNCSSYLSVHNKTHARAGVLTEFLESWTRSVFTHFGSLLAKLTESVDSHFTFHSTSSRNFANSVEEYTPTSSSGIPTLNVGTSYIQLVLDRIVQIFETYTFKFYYKNFSLGGLWLPYKVSSV